MPTLTLKTCPPQDTPRRRALADALTRITAQTLGTRPEVTAVIIDGVPTGHWFIGGRTQQARRPASPTLATPPP